MLICNGLRNLACTRKLLRLLLRRLATMGCRLEYVVATMGYG